MDNGERNYRVFLSGDDNGMVELVEEFADSLMLYLNNYVDDIYIAEDLMQETFIKLAMNKPKYNSKKGSFKTWLYSIGRNTAIDYLRKNRKHKKVSLDDCPELESNTDIETEALISERNRSLYKAIRSLKSEYRQVIYLIYFDGFNNTEVSKILHKNKHQTENLIYYAKKALKSELERCGFVYEEQ